MGTLALLIPAYNAARFLPRLLKSAQAQSVPFDEIYVYDDCSTDDTAAVAETFGAIVIPGDVNRGCSAGKHALAQIARSEWVHFHDADDELLPDFVEVAKAWMHEPVDIVLFGFEERNDESGNLLSIGRFEHERIASDPRKYAINNQINAICGIYRLDAYKRAGGYDLDPHVHYNEDVAFHIRMAFAGLRFAADPHVTIINHRRLNSMSSGNAYKCILSQYAVMRKTLDHPASGPYHIDIGRRLWALAGAFGSYRDWCNADEAVNIAQRLSPPSAGSPVFKLVCRISPRFALRAREVLVRLTRPHLRIGFERPST